MLRIALVLALLVSGAARAGHQHDAVARLRASLADLHHLREVGEVRFTGPSAEARYLRAMRGIEDAILHLGGGSGVPPQNWRGQAVLLIRQTLSSAHATAAIAALPSFVTRDDHGFVEALLRQLSSSQVPPALASYYLHASLADETNRRGAAATAVLRLSSSYVNRVLATLPAYVPAGDADFVSNALEALSSASVEPVFSAFFSHAPSTLPGNARGAVGTMIVQSVSTPHIAASCAAVPSHVSESDLPAVRQIIGSTSSSKIPQALRELFGTR